jgi:hypothetical protein
MKSPLMLFSIAALVVLVGNTAVLAQDRIITMEGEQISCRIIEEDSLNVVYMLHGVAQGSEVMPRYRVFRIERNLPEEKRWVRRNRPAWESSRGNKMKGFKLGLAGGNSTLLVPITTTGTFQGSRSIGFNIMVDGAYYFGRYFGLGARYSMFRLHTIYVHFVSVNPTLRVPIRKGKAHFLFGLAGGYAQKAVSSENGTGGYIDAFAASFGGGFDVRIIPKLYIGLTGEFIVGFFDSSRSSFGYSRAYRENMSRVDSRLGLSYYF